jgi:hypothetical protein
MVLLCYGLLCVFFITLFAMGGKHGKVDNL